jgi:hypothetical protein
MKNEGMSPASVHGCLSEIKSLTVFPVKRIAAVGQLPEKYISDEYGKLSMQHKKWHIS